MYVSSVYQAYIVCPWRQRISPTTVTSRANLHQRPGAPVGSTAREADGSLREAVGKWTEISIEMDDDLSSMSTRDMDK